MKKFIIIDLLINIFDLFIDIILSNYINCSLFCISYINNNNNDIFYIYNIIVY